MGAAGQPGAIDRPARPRDSSAGIRWRTEDMRFFKDDEGQGLVEYALVLVLVAVVVIAILALLGPYINDNSTYHP